MECYGLTTSPCCTELEEMQESGRKEGVKLSLGRRKSVWVILALSLFLINLLYF